MQVPLEVCREFGQFAFQDEQKGVEAIDSIQGFMEEYQDDAVAGDGSQAKARAVTIERNQAGIITAAKSVKLLPNVQINLKTLIQDTLERLQETVNFSTIVIGGPLTTDSWLIDVGAALYLLKFAVDLKTVELKQEQAGVLVALHHLSRSGELQLEIPLQELQTRMQQNNFNLSAGKLDDVLEDLVDLRCVSRQQDVIYLTEKVILKDN
ncbi:hypothetical protein [Candidatus Parabeggiatoa sp. HSG14]|uniref:hypothetical protein n=1 Tax=Candidatus Parabeggiatoa sp. HSG14 TaxID=3055593 RepID=UPI0025A7F010|nr:hypothetical protein [Thiotrichales bacterium HSG14]